MARNLLLYTPPLALRFAGLPALGITGILPGYTAGVAYEGRLQIINNIGDCTVQWVSGKLPPGAKVRVDNGTHEVVVEWPAYTPPSPEDVSAVPNGSFEQGDDGQWLLGGGWTIDEYTDPDSNQVYDGTHSAGFRNFRGESSIYSAAVPCEENTSITLTAKFRQGASSSGNLKGAALLAWCDESGKILSETLGNVITSDSGSGYRDTSVTDTAPAGTRTVRAGLWAIRRRQNRPARADHFVWNHSYTVGTISDEDYCVLLRVRDSAGRTAVWFGCVTEHYIYVTTKPYPFVADDEHLTIAAQIDAFVHKNSSIEPGAVTDQAGVGVALTAFLHIRPDQTVADNAGIAVTLTGFQHKDLSQTVTENAGFSAVLDAFLHVNWSHTVSENSGISVTLIGFEHNA